VPRELAKKKIAKERTTKIGAATLITVAMIFNVMIAQAREMGHYAPGVVSIRDLAVPPEPGFFMPSTMPTTRRTAMSMAMATVERLTDSKSLCLY